MNIGSIGYSICALTYLIFFSVLLTDKHQGATKKLLILASLASCLWATAMSYQAITGVDLITPQVLEFARDTAWIMLLLKMLSVAYGTGIAKTGLRIAFSAIVLFVVAMTIPVIYQYLTANDLTLGSSFDYLLDTHLLLSVIVIVLVEQLYRNTKKEQRWVIKFLCLGLGSMYVFDFYMYSDGLLYQRIDMTLWHTRGFVDALVVPLIGVAIIRDPLWSPEIFISRKVVFHTTSLLASGAYLMTMGVAGYYVRDYGGSWGLVAQAFFLFFTILTLFLFLFSKRIRARWKVLLNKHFYPYKYDYRDEWLRFIRTISSTDADSNVFIHTIRSLAQIIDSPGGVLFLRKDSGFYECVGSIEMQVIKDKEPSKSSLPIFLEENEFVISVDEFKENPEVYNRLGFLELPDWINEIEPWLIIPLVHIDKLIGYVVLDHSRVQKRHFNWEDSDLLKTAARQAASFIAQRKVSDELAEAKQFESYNKLSTYVVHDIKNLVSQLSLITTNAVKHKNNPLFMDDAINTISNSVEKMNKMIGVLQGKVDNKPSDKVNIIPLLEELVISREKSGEKPMPELGCDTEEFLVKADKDQLLSIFGHLVQNAQDATPDNGSIDIIQSSNVNNVIIEIRDTGTGMDEEFINTNLFKPFKTTKGSKGMGIGVYETREIISALGGEIEVSSQLGQGTSFKVTLPIANVN